MCTSCSLIYDGDVFDTTDAAPPPPPIDAMPPPPDVDVGALMLEALEPAMVLEGEGTGRPLAIVIRGSNMAPGATLTLSGPGLGNDGEAVEAPVVIGAQGTLAAFELTVPVLPELADGAAAELTVTMRQGEGVEASLVLPVRGLDELVFPEDAPALVTLSTNDLKARYSRIVLDREVRLTGAEPARLIATAELVVSKPIHADGAAAAGTTPGQGGPGGCNGGRPQEDAECGLGSGKRGQGRDGGGGGGHATQGTSGEGDVGNNAGSPTGSPMLTPLVDPAGSGGARGNGGGGGGGEGLGGEQGGGGGGGGGILELTSAATLRITADAALSANGGNGGVGGGNCVIGGKGGGGGGGSGGAILLRAATSLVDEGSTARVSVTGGLGGDSSTEACDEIGGRGGTGRVRIDAPEPGMLPPLIGSAVPQYRGPMLEPTTPIVTREAMLPIKLIGAPNTDYYIERVGADREPVRTSGDGTKATMVNLAPGHNRVCAVVFLENIGIDKPEGINCLSVAYIPQSSP